MFNFFKELFSKEFSAQRCKDLSNQVIHDRNTKTAEEVICMLHKDINSAALRGDFFVNTYFFVKGVACPNDEVVKMIKTHFEKLGFEISVSGSMVFIQWR